MSDRDHGMPDTVVRSSDELFVLNDRLARGLHMTVIPEVFEQYRTGYRCLACHHFPQPEPFPKTCCEPYCRFPMKRDQMIHLEREFGGVEDLWPTRGDDEIREDLSDQGVWLPN